MKKSLFVVLALLALGRAFAQTTTVPLGPSIPEQLDSLFKPLNKAEITSGLLFSKAIPLVEPTDYVGSINDTNYPDINVFGMLYDPMLGIRPKNLFFTFFIRRSHSGGGKPYLRRRWP